MVEVTFTSKLSRGLRPWVMSKGKKTAIVDEKGVYCESSKKGSRVFVIFTPRTIPKTIYTLVMKVHKIEKRFVRPLVIRKLVSRY